MADIQRIHRFEISLDVTIGNDVPRDALAICRRNDLIVDVREILDIMDNLSLLCEITTNDIPRDKRTRIAYVRIVIRGNAAAINRDFPLFLRVKRFLPARHRIINFQHLIASKTFLLSNALPPLMHALFRQQVFLQVQRPFSQAHESGSSCRYASPHQDPAAYRDRGRHRVHLLSHLCGQSAPPAHA